MPFLQLRKRSAGATPVLFIALCWILLQIFTGTALACEALDPTSREFQSWLLIEQGIWANFEGRLRDADAIWKELRAHATLLSGRTEEAQQIIAHMTPEDPNLVQWGGAFLLAVRGQIHDARGERSRAVGEYEKVLRLEGPRRQRRATMLAKLGLETPFSPATFSEPPIVAAAD